MNSEGKYYLYRHIRLDKNEPFYIGVGTKCDKNKYNRANTKNGRNSIWDHITSKTEFKVEIVLESDSKEFISDKEVEFIKLYGRLCDNTGILSNIESGGTIEKTNPLLQKNIYCRNNRTWYDSISNASFELNIERAGISRCITGEVTNVQGYVFSINDEDYTLNIGDGWVPIIDEKYGYYMNELMQIKKVFLVKDNYGNIINSRENVINPVKRPGNYYQITISHKNKRFNVNLKKLYLEYFNKNIDDGLL